MLLRNKQSKRVALLRVGLSRSGLSGMLIIFDDKNVKTLG